MLCHLGVSCHENQTLDSRLRDLDAVERVQWGIGREATSPAWAPSIDSSVKPMSMLNQRRMCVSSR